jgi:two-component system nitrogen regulation response regulator NtrX
MAKDALTVLVCEDDALYQRSLSMGLGDDFELVFCGDGPSALRLAQKVNPDLVLLDVQLGDGDDGFAVLPRLRALCGSTPVIIHSVLSDYASVVRGMRLGATDYVPKHCGTEKIKSQLQQLVLQHRRAKTSPTPHEEMVGQSPAVAALRETIARVQKFPGSVIITGESGVGKELVARRLRRGDEPFVAVDSSTIQQSTAESILFGHERGAFTGADSTRKGLLEEAHGGTLYFDEIANMSMDVQAKLLRALQEKEVVRLGASKAQPLEFRVVCATNRDLEELCQQGEFRYDLYTRISVFPVHVPPLRERPEDIPALLDHFQRLYAAEAPLRFDTDAMAQLCEYAWPGNVRELGNTVQYLLAMCDDGHVQVQHLLPKMQAFRRAAPAAPPAPVAEVPAAAPTPDGPADAAFYDRVRDFERRVLQEEYDLAGGNVSSMARKLQMDRSTLHTKLKDFGIHVTGPTPKRRR